MDDNPYRSPLADVATEGARQKPGAFRWVAASVRPVFLLCGGAASTLYGITLLSTVLPSPRTLGQMLVGLVLGTVATFGGAFMVIYASRVAGGGGRGEKEKRRESEGE